MAAMTRPRADTGNKVVGGVVGGIAGGIVFGLLMAWMGMMPMIASMAGSNSPAVGWLIHLAISIFIGVTFALIFGERSATYGAGLLWGAIYGAIWWVLGPLLIMSALLGMPLFMINSTTLMSLLGHIIYGLLLGLGFVWYTTRRS